MVGCAREDMMGVMVYIQTRKDRDWGGALGFKVEQGVESQVQKVSKKHQTA